MGAIHRRLAPRTRYLRGVAGRGGRARLEARPAARTWHRPRRRFIAPPRRPQMLGSAPHRLEGRKLRCLARQSPFQVGAQIRLGHNPLRPCLSARAAEVQRGIPARSLPDSSTLNRYLDGAVRGNRIAYLRGDDAGAGGAVSGGDSVAVFCRQVPCRVAGGARRRRQSRHPVDGSYRLGRVSPKGRGRSGTRAARRGNSLASALDRFERRLGTRAA